MPSDAPATAMLTVSPSTRSIVSSRSRLGGSISSRRRPMCGSPLTNSENEAPDRSTATTIMANSSTHSTNSPVPGRWKRGGTTGGRSGIEAFEP
jgi:hypothetical protein